MVRGVSISIRRVADRPTLRVVFIAESSVEAIRNDEVLSTIMCRNSKFYPRWKGPAEVHLCAANNRLSTAPKPKAEMRYSFIDISLITLYHLFSYLYTKILIREVPRKAGGEM